MAKRRPKRIGEIRFMPIPGTYIVSFKKRTTGLLKNVVVEAGNEIEAGHKARNWLSDRGYRDYREYGISGFKEMQVGSVEYGASGIFKVWYRGYFLGPIAERVRLG